MQPLPPSPAFTRILRFINKHFSMFSVQGCRLHCSASFRVTEDAWTVGSLDGYDVNKRSPSLCTMGSESEISAISTKDYIPGVPNLRFMRECIPDDIRGQKYSAASAEQIIQPLRRPDGKVNLKAIVRFALIAMLSAVAGLTRFVSPRLDGAIGGTVQDSSGLPIPKAKIAIRQQCH